MATSPLPPYEGSASPQTVGKLAAEAATLFTDATPIEATAAALTLLIRLHTERRHLLYGHTPTDAIPPDEKVLSTAWLLLLTQPDFTSDELLDALGLFGVEKPHSLKIKLGKILRSGGYSRRQGYRMGERPLLWVKPGAFEHPSSPQI